jgi:hypothetical protein
MPEQTDSETVAAIRELVEQVDHLGNAVMSAVAKIAQAIERHDGSSSMHSKGITSGGTFS